LPKSRPEHFKTFEIPFNSENKSGKSQQCELRPLRKGQNSIYGGMTKRGPKGSLGYIIGDYTIYKGRNPKYVYIYIQTYIIPKNPFVCPKKGISPNQSYDLGMGLRPSILL